MMFFVPVGLYDIRTTLFIFLVCCWTRTITADVLRPRGVPLAQKVFYESTKEFNCIDGSGVFPFLFVNDDYCDCTDGSDEPGTSACSNGHFHCVNAGYVSKEIPSSRVNDYVCDCCDGSDEYNSSAGCINTCVDMGNQAREEARKKEELFRKGYELFQVYSTEGKKIKESNMVKLESLKKLHGETDNAKVEKEAIMNDAESREKAALSKYDAFKQDSRKEAEEFEILKHEEEEKINAQEAFQELDLNHDDILTLDEVLKFTMFDTNRDGVVSEDEGKFFLHMKDSLKLEEFLTTGWMIMKPIYMIHKSSTHPASDIPAIPVDNVSPQSDYDESESYENEEDLSDHLIDEEEDDDSELGEQPEFPPKENSDVQSEKKDDPQYDEETQKLVDYAAQARKEFKEAADKLEEVQDEIKLIEDNIETDFGTEEQFAILKGQCFEFSDREYTYKLCPFDKASQISKSGGSEVNLGKWGHWAGPEDNKYSKMKYENGQSCWNGPSRSVMVLLYCGIENRILSASEPNRCEYLFEFSTPALCFSTEVVPLVHEHTEL